MIFVIFFLFVCSFALLFEVFIFSYAKMEFRVELDENIMRMYAFIILFGKMVADGLNFMHAFHVFCSV